METNNTKPVQPQLPAHLQELAKKIDERNAQWGFVDFSKLDRSKYDDSHPIHALLG